MAVGLACISLLLCVASHGEQGAADSGTLASVKATGSVRFSSAKISEASGLKPGQPLRSEDLQAVANRLAQLGVFSDVRYRFSMQQGKLEVEFQVVDGPSVAPLFDNFPWFTDDEIEQGLKSAVPLYDGRVPENGAILDDISQALSKLLETRKVAGTISHQMSTSRDARRKRTAISSRRP